MSRYWLHVNHPNDKAILHVEGGCAWVRKAVARVAAGQPYGPEQGDRNGYWAGPFASIGVAEAVQKRTGKRRQDRCRFCF